jgi:hypothetical protein
MDYRQRIAILADGGYQFQNAVKRNLVVAGGRLGSRRANLELASGLSKPYKSRNVEKLNA